MKPAISSCSCPAPARSDRWHGCSTRALARPSTCVPLFGDLETAAQERALAPAPSGRRKIVLATSIAETSLTIDGIRQVVDGGLARTARFDPRTGLTRLVTGPVTQRRQRAARRPRGPAGAGDLLASLGGKPRTPGSIPYPAPEILVADLSALALELAAWGAADPATLRLLDPPPSAAYAAAVTLLTDLEALDRGGRHHASRQVDGPAGPAAPGSPIWSLRLHRMIRVLSPAPSPRP